MLRKITSKIPVGQVIRRLNSNLPASTEGSRWPQGFYQPLYAQVHSKLKNKESELCQVQPWNSEQYPKLIRRPDDVLIKYWWSETPFERTQRLHVPIYTLETNEFINKTVDLEPLIFNQPIRRDIVHRVLNWSLLFGKKTTHRTKTPADVAGAGSKPFPQKGRGKARVGSRRASGRKKGGKIWGHRPKDFTYHLPEKVKIRGLLSCLSAKLAEGKIRVYESEKLEDHKTKHLVKKLPNDGFKELFLFVTPKVCDRNFRSASRGIARVKVVTPNGVCVKDLLKFDKLIFTVDSLREFTELLLGYQFMIEKPKAIRDKSIEDMLNLNFSRKSPDEEIPVYNPEEEWEPKFEILKSYYELYQNQKKQEKKQGNGEDKSK